ncbi:MAG: catalase [Oceanospirillales bacterium]|nr:MAG: catalase [Oceanospirillales bacterium]
MQVNGLSNTFGNIGVSTARANDTVQQPVQVVETTSPVSVQGDAGRRVAASSSTENSQNSSNTSRDRQQQDAEQQIIRELAARDREVRQHEMAHQMAGGQYTGAATYTFERGPDGVMYAVGGEVSIDTSPVPGDPEATLQKAQTIERAAMAPADPSPQDLKVAASARAMANEARAELLREQQDSLQSDVTEEVISDPLLGDRSSIEELQVREEEEQTRRAELQQAEREAVERRAEINEAEEASKERREAIAEEQQLRRERSAEAMREFARELAEIQARFRELNKRLVETGALQGRNTLGSILDRQA